MEQLCLSIDIDVGVARRAEQCERYLGARPRNRQLDRIWRAGRAPIAFPEGPTLDRARATVL
jgi:hypothetical protein